MDVSLLLFVFLLSGPIKFLSRDFPDTYTQLAGQCAAWLGQSKKMLQICSLKMQPQAAHLIAACTC